MEESSFRLYRRPIVAIYVRHASGCSKAHHGEFYRGCNCPKWLRWSLAGRQHRVTANTRSWNVAEEKREERQKRLDSPAAAARVKPVEGKQPTIEQLIESFITAKETSNIGPSRISKLRSHLPLLEKFLAERSIFFPADITKAEIEAFRNTWKARGWNDLTRIKAQDNFRSFIRYCCKGDHRAELLDAFPTIQQTKEGKKGRAPKPLTEDELKKLLAQIPITFAGNAPKIARLSAFVKAAVSLGPAIIDMVQLERAAVESSNGVLKYRRQKTGEEASPRIDESLHRELLSVANGNPRYVFWHGKGLPQNAVKSWQKDLKRLFEGAGLYIKGDLSHRFRDTAADFWLGAGCSMTEIAAMLGDTVAIVEKHYADLASKRMAERLAKLPARTWEPSNV